jgi:tetratricopeptide (TPR) repeat protein
MTIKRFLIGFTATALLATLVVLIWRWYTTPVPPQLSLAGAEPEVVAVMQAAVDDVRRRPRSAQVWGTLAMVLAAHDYNEQAVICYAQAEALDPSELRWPYLHGLNLLAARPGQAIALLRRASTLGGSGDEQALVQFRLALALIENGPLVEAEEPLEALRRLEPGSPRVLYAAGLLGIAREDWASARNNLAMLTENPFARKKACTLLATLPDGDRKSRRAYQQRADELPWDYAWPDAYAAEMRRHKVDRMSRIAQFRELEQQGRLNESLDYLRQFVAKSPDPEVCCILGVTLCDHNELQEGVEILRGVIQAEPRNVKALYYLGAASLRLAEKALGGPDRAAALGFARQAIAAVDQAIALQADHGYAHLTRGRALLLLGRTDEALEALRQAMRCRPEFADMHVALGEALAETGRMNEAFEHLENGVRLAAPDDPRPREALTKWRAKAKSSSSEPRAPNR